ncbi:MAG: hypothetical protein NFCOHLIN_03180 [Gammaproteobacteria bacterium]|nr:hypothetical protein [Gammaproteobacteria bacterium]
MKKSIQRNLINALGAGALVLAAHGVMAAENLADVVAEGCKVELESYCKAVTPGEGRVLACLYAHEDRLSGRCEYALYDAAAQLEHAIGALTYVANECKTDMQRHCADIQPGEGRLAMCLKNNEQQMSPRCQQAIKDVGLEVTEAQ